MGTALNTKALKEEELLIQEVDHLAVICRPHAARLRRLAWAKTGSTTTTSTSTWTFSPSACLRRLRSEASTSLLHSITLSPVPVSGSASWWALSYILD